MKHACFVSLFLCLITTFLLPQSNPVPLINQSRRFVAPISASQADPKAQARILDNYGKLPLSFEANHGQTDKRVKFLSRTSGYTLFLTGDEAVLALNGTKTNPNNAKIGSTLHKPQSLAAPNAGGVMRMKLRNANPAAKVTGVDELSGRSNYFIGNDPAKWHSKVPTYAKVKYEGIYSGIDLVYYGNQRQLEYDFIVAPGADPHRIAFDVGGAKRIRRDVHGDLVFKVGADEIRWYKPVVYQGKNGTRQEIAAHYAITETNRVGFEVAKYDASRPLYIDPLIYSTYLGGSGDEIGHGIAVDSAGNAYVIGQTGSTDFPTMNPLQPANAGGANGYDAFVSKINPAGSALVYSTYLGGTNDDQAYGIAVDTAGNAYVTGVTRSTDFPTMNPLQPANGGGPNLMDAFVAKLSPTGSALVYSTYLGGSSEDFGHSIAIDSVGNAYVTGFTDSNDFPTENPIQSENLGGDAFIVKINPAGSALIYSTYLGGNEDDQGDGIAVDSTGSAYVIGLTDSPGFPTKNPLQPVEGGGFDAFVVKINPTGSALVYSTFLGGSADDSGYAIAVDGGGNAYVTGRTSSTNFPTKKPMQPTNAGGYDAFVSKINPAGSALVYSTYLGGSLEDYAYGIAVDGAGNAYVIGETSSLNFPTQRPLQARKAGTTRTTDAFVSELDPSGSTLFYSTYLGGLAFDTGFGIAVNNAGTAYVTGRTSSTNFPAKKPMQPTNAGGYDAFVAKIDVRAATTTTLSSSLNPSTYGQAVTYTAGVTSVLGAPPDGETVSFMKGKTLLGMGALRNGSVSFATSTLKVGTNSITAVYGGDVNLIGSTSKNLNQFVDKATTTTALTSSPNPSKVGQSVTFTATVTPQFKGTVTGTVTFYDGTTLLKTVALSGGAAKFTTKTLSSGTHTITATYNGSTSFDGSSASLTQTVN